MSELDDHIRHVEWEFLAHPHELLDVEGIPQLSGAKAQVRVERGLDYDVRLSFSGKGESRRLLSLADYPQPGTVDRGRTISARFAWADGEAARAEFIRAFMSDLTVKMGGNFQATGFAHSFRWHNTAAGAPKRAFAYCASGPTELHFARGTRKSHLVSTQVERHIPESRTPEFWAYEVRSDLRSCGADSLFLQAGSFEVLCCKVPKSIAPEWLRPLSIQFEPDPAYFVQARADALIEAIGFALGRRLLPVGFSVFDEAMAPVELCADKARSFGLRTECQHDSYPPSFVEGLDRPDSALISKIAERYHSHCASLNLTEAMRYLWTARVLPFGPNLVFYTGCIEALARNWMNRPETQGHKTYVSQELFDGVAGARLEEIEKATRGDTSWQPVLHRLRQANRRGIADTVRALLEKNGLRTGEVEREALNARHRFAHGGQGRGDDDLFLFPVVFALESLINRIVLRLIGYDGPYVDYSTVERPKRDLEVPLGGPKGDGKLSLLDYVRAS
jgi:hypothetical protein